MPRTLLAVGVSKNARGRVRVLCSIVSAVCLVSLTHQVDLGAGSLTGDGSYLLALRRSYSCDSNEVFSDWKDNNSHPCTWSGVTCDPVSLRVISLRIVGKHFVSKQAQSPSSEVPCTQVSSDIGVEQERVDADAVSCGLVGTLSPAIWKLSELRELSIVFNRISGELPKDVAKLKHLRSLDLRSNLLTGRLPSELGKLLNLRFLNLDHNAFWGRIPDELSFCFELRRLSLAGNLLSGSIPPSLGNLSRLQWLSLSDNRLVGSIPKELAEGECTLRHLDLSGNGLTGFIPSELGVCSHLRWLLLNFNNLVGNIPARFGQLSSLKALQVAGNSLSGQIPGQLATCSKLEVIVLTMEQHTCKSYSSRAERNSFHGVLPPELGLLPRLRVLWAPGAGLTGVLPTDWGRCENLEGLNLAENAFTGELSLGLSNCKRLVFLDLSSNHLTGSINEQFPIACMRVFNVSRNILWGIPPECPGDCRRFLPATRRGGGSRTLSSCNLLGCIIPFRGLRGSRPHLFDMLLQRNLWINNSALQAQFQDTYVRDWSFNNFTGDVPLTALRRSMLTDSFAPGERTSALGTLPPQLLRQDQQGEIKKFGSILVAAITSGCAIAGVLFVLGILFQCTRHRNGNRQSPRPSGKAVVTFININHQLTYENVVRATGNFSIDNLIGSGGFGATYKAEMKPGLLVAVKRLAVGRFQGVQQFDTEIRTLGRIRHPNLVTLIGYHASQEEMFLIYNFFSKGNLETLIHTHRDEMDWRTRHSIAFRIAEALAYLHDCVPRVLHRDIKPSNILLDDELNAHLSDFGLARLLGASETHATTDVAGTFGYVAPEYAMTCRVTDKADVYSYGVVLLELLSSKRALDPSFCEYGDGFNIVSWACLLIRRGQASEVFASKLWENGPEKSLLEALKLAILCTVDQLSVRPAMKDVVYSLGKIQPTV